MTNSNVGSQRVYWQKAQEIMEHNLEAVWTFRFKHASTMYNNKEGWQDLEWSGENTILKQGDTVGGYKLSMVGTSSDEYVVFRTEEGHKIQLNIEN